VSPDLSATFHAIYRSELPYVWKTLRRLGVLPHDLEDVVHDLFVVVHRRLGDYDRSRPLRPWLFGIAVRVVSDYRRSSHRVHAALRSDAEPPPEAPIAEERVTEREARTLFLRALETLDLERRAVLVMHDLDEIDMPEIAAALSLPLNTAYSRLRLARADLSKYLQRAKAAGGWP